MRNSLSYELLAIFPALLLIVMAAAGPAPAGATMYACGTAAIYLFLIHRTSFDSSIVMRAPTTVFAALVLLLGAGLTMMPAHERPMMTWIFGLGTIFVYHAMRRVLIAHRLIVAPPRSISREPVRSIYWLIAARYLARFYKGLFDLAANAVLRGRVR